MSKRITDADWRAGTTGGSGLYEIVNKDECWFVLRDGCFVAAFAQRQLAEQFVTALGESGVPRDQVVDRLKRRRQPRGDAIRFRFVTLAGRVLP